MSFTVDKNSRKHHEKYFTANNYIEKAYVYKNHMEKNYVEKHKS